jgi:hypothetical protein
MISSFLSVLYGYLLIFSSKALSIVDIACCIPCKLASNGIEITSSLKYFLWYSCITSWSFFSLTAAFLPSKRICEGTLSSTSLKT